VRVLPISEQLHVFLLERTKTDFCCIVQFSCICQFEDIIFGICQVSMIEIGIILLHYNLYAADG